MKPIDLSKVVVCRKLSLLEHEMRRLHKGEGEILDYYRKIGADFEKIIASHKAQQVSYQKVLIFFPGCSVFEGRVLKKSFCSKDSIVLVLGGDNYFQYVSHFLDQQAVLGINSDPERSEGMLTYFKVDTLSNLFEALKKGKYKIEEWTRLQVNLDGKKLTPLAVSEVYVGSYQRFTISKYILEFNGKIEEQKSSGVLIATGAGSTGWYRSAVGNGREVVFSKEAKEGRFFVTEVFRGKLHKGELVSGIIKNGQEVVIISQNKHKSVISIDSKVNIGLPMGSIAKIGISDKRLKVLSI